MRNLSTSKVTIDIDDADGARTSLTADFCLTHQSLTVRDKDRNALASVSIDVLDGQLQLLIYGRAQHSGADGHISIPISPTGELEGVRIADFRDPPPVLE